MPKIKHNLTVEQRRQKRIRAKLIGSATRPRVTVFRSNQHFYIQAIDDAAGKTLAAANDMGKENKLTGTKTEKAIQLAEMVATELMKQKITAVVFDRGYYRYHGRVKATADTLRKAGLKV